MPGIVHFVGENSERSETPNLSSSSPVSMASDLSVSMDSEISDGDISDLSDSSTTIDSDNESDDTNESENQGNKTLQNLEQYTDGNDTQNNSDNDSVDTTKNDILTHKRHSETEFPEFSDSGDDDELNLPVSELNSDRDAENSNFSTDTNVRLFGVVSDDSSNQSSCLNNDENREGVQDNIEDHADKEKSAENNDYNDSGKTEEEKNKPLPTEEMQPIKLKIKVRHRDKFSAMKALMYGDNCESSDEESMDSQKSESNTPTKRHIHKPETIGKPQFCKATRKLFETEPQDSKEESPSEESKKELFRPFLENCDVPENDNEEKPAVDDPKSDEDVVFVSIGDRSGGTSKEPVVINDSESDSDDVVIVKTEKLKHKGIGKKSKRYSEKNDVIVCDVADGNSSGNVKKTVDTSGLSLVSDNSDDNNLVYPQVPATDSCMCDVFGMGSFGCLIHGQKKVSNPIHKELSTSVSGINNLNEKSNELDMQEMSEVQSHNDENDSSQDSCVLNEAEQTDNGTKTLCEKRTSPLLDMPLDFSSLFDTANLAENSGSKLKHPRRDKLSRSESLSVNNLEVIEISPEHPELSRSASLPNGRFDLKRKPDSEDVLDKKRSREEFSHCVTCLARVNTKMVMECMGGHKWCSSCIQVLVKTLLTGGTKGSLKCGMEDCENFFPTGQLEKVLPPMVVEVLQTKFDQEFLSMLEDGLGNETEDSNTSSTSPLENQEAQQRMRNESRGFSLTWDEMNENEDYRVVKLVPGTVEYVEVVTGFHETMTSPRATITKIERVQNISLWEIYSMKKKHMEKQLGDHGANEQKLFHGTKTEFVESICINNFDWRMCGENGTSYGQGSYFARDSSYSHRYTYNARPGSYGHISTYLPRYSNLPSSLDPTFAKLFSHLNTFRSQSRQPKVGHPSGNLLPSHHAMGKSNPSGQTQSSNSNQPSTSSATTGMQTGRSSINLGVGHLGHILRLRRTIQMQHQGPSSSRATLLNPDTSQGTSSAFHPVNNTNTSQPTLNQVGQDPVASHIVQDEQKSKHTMFLCKVLCGKSTLGRPGFRIPPLIDETNPSGARFDTCVDNIVAPNIYVVFDRAQCYPDYVIYYENTQTLYRTITSS